MAKNLLQYSILYNELFEGVDSIQFLEETNINGGGCFLKSDMKSGGCENGRLSPEARFSQKIVSSNEKEKVIRTESSQSNKTGTPSRKLSSDLHFEELGEKVKKQASCRSSPRYKNSGSKMRSPNLNLEPQSNFEKSNDENLSHLIDSHPLRSLLHRNMFYLKSFSLGFDSEQNPPNRALMISDSSRSNNQNLITERSSSQIKSRSFLRDSVNYQPSLEIIGYEADENLLQVGKLNRKLADLEKTNMKVRDRYCNLCSLI